MDYKLFDEHILLQALLKNLGVLHSGGAIKDFLAHQTVLLNGIDEKRRRKKIRVGDQIHLPAQELTITIVAPDEEERKVHQEEQAEKERVVALVKKMNADTKKRRTTGKKQPKKTKTAVRFPGT